MKTQIYIFSLVQKMSFTFKDWDIFFYFVFDYTNYAWSFTSLKHTNTWRDAEIYLTKALQLEYESLLSKMLNWTMEQRKILDSRGLRIARLNARPDKNYDQVCAGRLEQWQQNMTWCKEAVLEMIPPVIMNVVKASLNSNDSRIEHVVLSNNVEECDAFDLHLSLLPLERNIETDGEDTVRMNQELNQFEKELDERESRLHQKLSFLDQKEALLLRYRDSIKRAQRMAIDKDFIGTSGFYIIPKVE